MRKPVLFVVSIRALLVVTVIGVPGFGSNNDVQVKNRIKNVAADATLASDSATQGGCNGLDDDLENEHR